MMRRERIRPASCSSNPLKTSRLSPHSQLRILNRPLTPTVPPTNLNTLSICHAFHPFLRYSPIMRRILAGTCRESKGRATTRPLGPLPGGWSTQASRAAPTLAGWPISLCSDARPCARSPATLMYCPSCCLHRFQARRFLPLYPLYPLYPLHPPTRCRCPAAVA